MTKNPDHLIKTGSILTLAEDMTGLPIEAQFQPKESIFELGTGGKIIAGGIDKLRFAKNAQDAAERDAQGIQQSDDIGAMQVTGSYDAGIAIAPDHGVVHIPLQEYDALRSLASQQLAAQQRQADQPNPAKDSQHIQKILEQGPQSREEAVAASYANASAPNR